MQGAIEASQVATARLISVTTIVIILLAGAYLLLVTRGVGRAVNKGLDAASGALKNIAGGHLDFEVHGTERQDALGDLARAAVRLREVSLAKQQADAGLHGTIDIFATNLAALANGDLRVAIDGLPAEYERLRVDFNQATRALEGAMLRVADAAESIHTGSSEISQASDDLSRRTEHQAAALEQTAAALQEITGSVRETASQVAAANQAVTAAEDDATSSGTVVREAVAAMADIERSADQIAQITQVIDGIAFQTNLLALNAGVEAARAGDAGKGFAVVASEVRALAQRSAEAAKDIKELIEQSNAQVSDGARLVAQTGEALERILSRVAVVSKLIHHISDATTREATSLAEVNVAIGEMDQTTQQNAAMVEESTAAARHLADQAGELSGLVGRFQLNGAASRPERMAAVTPTPLPVPAARASRPLPVRGNLAVAPAAEDDWSAF
ncbi:hypothetical protein KOF26_01410 [Sphingomonas sp. XMGL2]|uniref:Methyl-accepting chemotaxis protein n=2 Tax=Sphingomonas quercus TaxID=2842451 RepID=A0ABS6BDX4_9SPHN|nr:hypothetical protein [Sphingomonas quercus]